MYRVRFARWEVKTVANGLTFERGRDMPLGMQILAATKIIEQKTDPKLQALMEVDVDCSFCLHATLEPPCADEVPMVFCTKCPYTCPCSECYENSKYEWCGDEEALRRLADMKGEQ